MQGALSAHCYDPSTPDQYVDSIPDYYAQYWTNGAPCYFNGINSAGTFVNFFNTNDYALNLWTDDEDSKPDTGYSYISYQGFLNGFTPLYFPTNTYQIFAYADPAESYALGAQQNVAGPFKVGATYNQIELDAAPFNYDAKHLYHSMEFRQDYAQNLFFWSDFFSLIK